MVFNLNVVDTPVVLFKILYFLSKANGLLPITLAFDSLGIVYQASNSLTDVLYSVVYAFILLIGLVYSQSTIIAFIGILHNPKFTIIFVFLTQVSCNALRLAAIYFSQIFNYKNLSSFVNRSVRINERFGKTDNRRKTFLDAKLSKWCLSRFVSCVLQVVLMLVPTAGFIEFVSSSEDAVHLLVTFIFILYTHMVLILSTGVYFCGMIVIGQFYRNLNSHIWVLHEKFSVPDSTKVEMQQFCNLSDEFDELTALYRDITKHANNFNKYQRCFTFFSLTQYFVILLAEMFDVYTQIMRSIRLNANVRKNSIFTQLLKEFGFFSFYAMELYYTIRVTSFVQDEVRKTSALLKLCNRPTFDVRLRKSIEVLSLHTLVHTPKMTVCGLFEISNSLLFGMAATFTTYLVVLVQFVEDE